VSHQIFPSIFNGCQTLPAAPCNIRATCNRQEVPADYRDFDLLQSCAGGLYLPCSHHTLALMGDEASRVMPRVKGAKEILGGNAARLFGMQG
jgi:hypothetical protein